MPIENIVVTEAAWEMRKIARETLKNNWGKVWLCCFIFLLMTATLPIAIVEIINGIYPIEIEGMTRAEIIAISPVRGIYSIFMSGALSLGLSYTMLRYMRTRIATPDLIFKGFENYLKAFGLFFLMSLFIILWSLLLIIPGIIASYRYSQAFYILADDPSKSPMQCINESKEMMRNNKGTLFVLELSFIGWLILGFVAGSGLSYLLVPELSFMPEWLSDTLENVIFSAVVAVVNVYMTTAVTFFYERVSGHLVKTAEGQKVFDHNTRSWRAMNSQDLNEKFYQPNNTRTPNVDEANGGIKHKELTEYKVQESEIQDGKYEAQRDEVKNDSERKYLKEAESENISQYEDKRGHEVGDFEADSDNDEEHKTKYGDFEV